MRLLTLILSCVLLVVGCESTPPTTELLVVVDSDLQAGSELAALHIEVRDRDGGGLRAEHDLRVSALPLSFSLYPLGEASSLRLVVVGRDARGADVVEQQWIARFVAEQRALLAVYLRRSCLGVFCRNASGARTDRTCTYGACEPTVEAPLDTAGQGPLGGYALDASVSEVPEGSRVDARMPVEVDTNAACKVDGDCAAKLGTVEPAGCAVARCLDGDCVFEAVDEDRDGDRRRGCRASGVELVLGMDCDDRNRAVSSREWDGPAGKDGDTLRADRCDRVDNDCNGKADDARLAGASCECDPARDIEVACSQRADGTEIVWPAGTPVGACRAGKRSCVDGAWTPCTGAVVPLASDRCTTADDDSNCNGVQGENCQCTNGATRPCGTDVGSCKPGVQTCVQGRWASECAGAVTPKPADSCDAMNDDNCNGSANDGCSCVNGTESTCGEVLPALGDCLSRRVTCTGGVWPTSVCMAQCDDCPADDPCAPGSCIDGVNDFSCDCPSEYEGDGSHACTPRIRICELPGAGMDGGTVVRCGPHARCVGTSDGGFGCSCEEDYAPIANSDPPACE